MASYQLSWNLGAVLAIHILRLVLGVLAVQFVYPFLFTPTSFVIEVTDRLIMIGLVLFGISKEDHRSIGLSLDYATANIVKGIIVGLILLMISLCSERILTIMLLLTPTSHPLILQAQNAASWQDLLSPLFLAGILAPFSEELLYRVFTFLPMKKRWGVAGGALVSSLLFALMHFNVYWLGEMILVGMGLAFLYHWTGSIISSIVAHSLVNTLKILMLYFHVT